MISNTTNDTMNLHFYKSIIAILLVFFCTACSTEETKYAEEMTKAAAQMETLNGLYQIQLQSAERNAQINNEVAENNLKLKDQMQSLTSNLSTLNNVYGGMLSAMSNKG